MLAGQDQTWQISKHIVPKHSVNRLLQKGSSLPTRMYKVAQNYYTLPFNT